MKAKLLSVKISECEMEKCTVVVVFVVVDIVGLAVIKIGKYRNSL